jgi:hypothetical protein
MTPAARDRLACLEALVQSLAAALRDAGAEPGALGEPLSPTVFYHGERSYSMDGQTPVNVSVEKHRALLAFLDRNRALDTVALKRFGMSNPTVVMKKLDRQFPGAVRTPANKGDGYFIRVRSLPKRC